MIPKTIGRYRIKGELGRGGMSTVYLAHDPHFDRDVAVKLLPLELLHQRNFRRRFEREAKVVAALDHPAIVPVYDFGEEKGQPFLVMRFMPGGSLSDRLKQGAFSVKETAAIISRLAPALDEVHAHGVIHRDLKPSNILFDQRMDPYISDFGTAKLVQAQTKLTDTGGAIGTPAYMSPEQIQGDAEVDGRSDIYSLGVILFEMLSGSHPFQTDTPIAVAVKHIFEPVPYILDAVPDLPIQCQEIIMQAMAKNKADRFLNAEQFANTLATVADNVKTGVLPIFAQDQGKTAVKRYALLIHNDQFHDFILSKLVRPSANVKQLAAVLKEPDIGNFDEVAILHNESAQTIRREISTFFANKKQNDLLLLYYSGHAAVGTRSRLYFAANNTEHNLLRGTAIPAGFIADEMDNCLSKQQILILDCHFSSAIDTNLPSLVGQTVNSGATFAHNGHDRVVITATDSTQYNWHNNDIRGKATPSQFTRHLIHGLESGAADIDQDGQININELYAYIYDRVARNSIDEHIQMPRKWTPYTTNDESKIIIAHRSTQLDYQRKVQKSTNPILERVAKLPQQYLRYSVLGLLALVVGLLFVVRGGSAFNESTPAFSTAVGATPSAVEAIVPTEGSLAQIEDATATPIMTITETAVSTQIPTQTETATALPTATITVESTPEAILLSTALLSSSVYEQPNSDGRELAFVGVGEEVEILGRSTFGVWLYIRTEGEIEGFVYGPRFDWEGEYDLLTAVEGGTTSQPPSNTQCNGSDCPTLSADIYPLSSFCIGDQHYKSVFMQGHGGNNVYTYYWDDVRVAGPLTESGFSYDVHSSDGTAVIGQVKITSGDGQVVEKELFISDFSCNG